MSVTVSGVDKGSAADRCGFAPGDILERMDGHDIQDVLDYRFYMQSRRLTLEGVCGDGKPFVRKVRKGEYDDLGLQFDTYLMDRQRSCRNKCVFCFIDQLPKGLRDSLYFKDDDSRMSFLFGNYITLTNLEERDVQRILDMHISPVNISVHTMNPALRVSMMKNPHAGQALAYIPRLAQGGIRINAQLVLCPGINDGRELEHSLEALCALTPQVQSVAVVPVGLTSHREGLAPLRLFTGEEAGAVIDLVDRYGHEMNRLHGQRTCYAADEFYLAAGRKIPPASFYGDFPQLENGVGLLALLLDEFHQALGDEDSHPCQRQVTLATGVAAAPYLIEMAEKAQAHFPGLSIRVVPVVNTFFGETITVAGLVTGRDLLGALQGTDLGDALLIPAVMLRSEGDLFLDDVSLDDLVQESGVPVLPVPNDGYALLDAFLGRETPAI